jgi:hypothetical protein
MLTYADKRSGASDGFRSDEQGAGAGICVSVCVSAYAVYVSI